MKSFNLGSEFEKELKRLSKKYRSLHDDLENFKKVLLVEPTGIGGNFIIIHVSKEVTIIKARLACRYLHSRDMRIVYGYVKKEQRIDFIELYFKGDKENEDYQRIKEYREKVES